MKKLLIAIVSLTTAVSYTPLSQAQEYESGYHIVQQNSHVRNLPSMEGKIIGSLDQGDSAFVIERNNNWCHIEYFDYKNAHVFCGLLEKDLYDYSSFDFDTEYNNYESSDSLDETDNDEEMITPWFDEEESALTVCNPSTEMCSGNFQISLTGYVVADGLPRNDLNLHANGAIDLTSPTRPMVSLNINGSAGSMENSMRGSAQIISTGSETYIKFTNMHGGELLGEFPMAQDTWYTSPHLDTAASFHTLRLMNVSDFLPNSHFVGKEQVAGATQFHYQVPLNSNELFSMVPDFTLTPHITDTALLEPKITLDYWTNTEGMLTKIIATLYIASHEPNTSEAHVELSLSFTNINKNTEIILPASHEVTPLPDIVSSLSF